MTWSKPVLWLSAFVLGAPAIACLVLIQLDPGVSFALVTEFVKISIVCLIFTGLAFAYYMNKEKAG